ncbi:hypothetical protein H4R33_001458 [Dimargaris cristalligena]|nr:hypothetical protein H4R33_001458 [Dimargaris cristalligena]
MKSQRVNLIGLVVLDLAAQLVISAPSLYSDATNSGNSSSTHDTTNNRSKFVKESVEGQQDRLSTLPPEILKQIIGPLVTDESIFELMEVSKFLRSFIFNHFEKEYILLESDLDNYLNVYDEELQWMDNSYADEFEIMPLANPIIFRDFARCHLVSNIRKSGLLNAAEFLASKWNCKVAPEVSPVELDAQPERGNIREWMDPDLIKTYYRILRGIELHLPNLLTLTNDNQMGVMALVSEFEPSEKARVSDLGPWSTNKEKIRRVYSAMDPAIYNELTGPEARESKYFLGEY